MEGGVNMIQWIANIACRRKACFCMILAAFFYIFTIVLSINTIIEEKQMFLSSVQTHKVDTSNSGNMTSGEDNNELLFGSALVCDMNTYINQYLVQGSIWNKSAAPIMRFVLSWFGLILAIGLIIRFLYLIKRDRLLNYKFYLDTILMYIHNCDGAKTVNVY